MLEFKHPLARESKIVPLGGVAGETKDMLIGITTLQLAAGHAKFKEDKVKRLKDAARAWIAETHAAADFVLVNRPRDWA